MSKPEPHDCEKEYWRHCLRCVAGDPDAEITEWFAPDGKFTEATIKYPDGSTATLVRGPNGWEWPETLDRCPCDVAARDTL